MTPLMSLVMMNVGTHVGVLYVPCWCLQTGVTRASTTQWCSAVQACCQQLSAHTSTGAREAVQAAGAVMLLM
jgi:hypothetical protein